MIKLDPCAQFMVHVIRSMIILYLFHEVVWAEEVAGAPAHDEGSPVDVDHHGPHLVVQPRRIHVQADQ